MNTEDYVYLCVQSGELEIDRSGRVWRVKQRFWNVNTQKADVRVVPRKRAEHDNGVYLQVRALIGDYRYNALAHRLVWRHFNGPIPDGLQVNHKDGCKKNNKPRNLEAVTVCQNMQHAVRVLGVGPTANQRGMLNHAAVLTDQQVDEIRLLRNNGLRLNQIAVQYGVAFQTISKICRMERRV